MESNTGKRKAVAKKKRTSGKFPSSASYDSSLFTSSWSAKAWNQYATKPVISGRRVALKQENVHLLTDHLNRMGWEGLTNIPLVYYPESVRYFYCNMNEKHQDGQVLMSSFIKGQEIVISQGWLATLLQCPDDGENVHFRSYEDMKNTLDESTMRDMCQTLLGRDSLVGTVSTNEIKQDFRLMSHYIAHNIVPKKGHFDQMKALQCYILYCIVSGRSINLAYIIIKEMSTLEKRRALPFGSLITLILTSQGINLENETPQNIGKSIDGSSITKMKQRKTAIESEEGEDDSSGDDSEGDIGGEMPMDTDPAVRGPGQTSRRSTHDRLDTIEQRLGQIELTQTSMRSELRSEMAEMHHEMTDMFSYMRSHFPPNQ